MNQRKTKMNDDFLFNYLKCFFFFGLIHKASYHSYKIGDGLNIYIIEKLMLPLFHKNGNKNYSMSIFRHICRVYCLGAKEAHKYIWNRTTNLKGGYSKNIPLDLRMEHRVKSLKQSFSAVCPNLTPEYAHIINKSIHVVDKIKENIFNQLQIKYKSGKHSIPDDSKEFKKISQIIKKVLHEEQGRSFGEFKIPSNIFYLINETEQLRYLKLKRKELSKYYFEDPLG